MTKLVKVLLIGGTSTAVAGGTAAGVGVSLTNKKSTNVTKPVAKAVSKYAVPTLQTAPEAKQMAIPPVQGIKIPHMVLRPTVPAGGFVFGGHSQEAVPPLRGTYQTHEGFGHAEAIGGYLQMTPEVHPQAVPYEVPKLIVSPTVPAHGLVFGGHTQEIVPPLKGTTQTHEGVNGAAVVWTNDLQATPYLHVNLEAKAALPSFSGIREIAPVKIENPEVFSGTGYAVPTFHQEVPQPLSAEPMPVLPEQKVPMMINNYGPISSNWYATAIGHDRYESPVIAPALKEWKQDIKEITYVVPAIKYEAPQELLKDGMRTEPIPTPSIIAPTPRLIIVPQLKYPVPSLRAEKLEMHVSTEVQPESMDVAPAGKIADAHIVGAVRQPYFETFVATPVRWSSVDLTTGNTFGAVYHSIEGVNHAQSPEFIAPTPVPYAIPTLTPKLLPVVDPVWAPEEHVHPAFGADVEELSMPTPVSAEEIYLPQELSMPTPVDSHTSHVHTGNSIIDSLINHIHSGMSILEASKQVFREVAWGQHHGYEDLDYRNMYNILSQHVPMHQDHSQHVSLTMNDFRDAFNDGFAAVRHESGFEGHFGTLDRCHTFLLHR